jgi:hypothetical protein
MVGMIYPNGPSTLWVFLLVTVVIGGAAAWTTGRAIAKAWRGPALVPFYMLPLAAAVRFLHYALFAEPFFSPHYYLVDYVVLVSVAGLGYRRMRACQMVQQYGWTYLHHGIFSWREQAPIEGIAEL